MPDETLEWRAGTYLRRAGYKLALAESCTGGLLSHRITNVPGASDYFLGSIIAYANQVKQDLLDVPPATLLHNGAVSRETVLAMAQGVRRLFAQWAEPERILGIAISGIAGPAGGTPEKPVGLVWIAIGAASGEIACEHHFKGDRFTIKEKAAASALKHLISFLNTHSEAGS